MSLMNKVLKLYVGKDVQVKFKGELAPGPTEGKLQEFRDDTPGGSVLDGIYTIEAHMMYGNPNGGSKPVEVTLPMTFSVEDVLWVSLGPVDEKGHSAIVVPGGNRTPGGLHIGG